MKKQFEIFNLWDNLWEAYKCSKPLNLEGWLLTNGFELFNGAYYPNGKKKLYIQDNIGVILQYTQNKNFDFLAYNPNYFGDYKISGFYNIEYPFGLLKYTQYYMDELGLKKISIEEFMEGLSSSQRVSFTFNLDLFL